jgi:hypothetical protein
VRAPKLLGLDRDSAAHLRRSLVPLDEHALLDSARRRTGLTDFGDGRFREGLGRLLRSYDTEACLSSIGRIAARQDTLQLLETRLRLERDRRRFPGIVRQEIRKPIFIAGLPRSGTTLLHNLMAQDPANRVPMSWEVMFPSPPPSRALYETDSRIVKAEKTLRWLDRLAPEFRAIHSMGARLPQECIAITSYAFESPRFHTTHNVVSYQAWLTGRDLHTAYAFHRRMLQHLQWRCFAPRWVLKSPAHLFAFDAIFKTYPDACIVQTHRDPLEVLSSTASLTAVLRRAFSDKIDLEDIGAEVTQRWAEGIRRAMAVRNARGAARDRFLDVRYRDLVSNPIATVRRIYAGFELEWTGDVEARMQRFLSANPQYKHGKHDYALARFGLVPEDVKSLFQSYRDRFLVELEAA